MRRLGLAILALSVTACSYTNADEDTRVLYSGHFAYGFETSSFVPCEGGEKWWVSGGAAYSQFISAYSAAVSDDYNYESAYAEIIGVISDKGSYGHLGAYDRELQVNEVVEVRAASAGDCR